MLRALSFLLNFAIFLIGGVLADAKVNSIGNPSIARTHDILGRLDSETSNGITSSYGHDLLHRVAKVSNNANTRLLSIQHDPAGHTHRIVDLFNGSNLTTEFGHDLTGNPVIESMSNGFTKESDFDPIRRITSQRIRNSANQNIISRNDYQYDLTSNVTRIEESTAALNIPDRIIQNTYNERRQLLTENQTQSGGSLGNSIHSHSEIHRYDLAENRISTQAQTLVDGVLSSTLARAFDFGDATDGFNSNQLRQLTEITNNGLPVLSNYTFDNNGNRAGKTIGSASDIYTYDSFDRLSHLALNTASSAENGNYHYRYDPLTRRISRSVGVSPTSLNTHQFAFSGSTPVHEWDGALNNGSRLDHIGGGIGGKLYTQDGTGNTRYPFHNARGDIMAEFTSGGTLTWHGTHTSSGILQSQTGTRSSNYGANGKWEEPCGLINDGYRYRDRSTNTFITADPAGFIDGPNTYNYAGHNPWSAWDPNGLDAALYTTTTTIGYWDPPSSNVTNSTNRAQTWSTGSSDLTPAQSIIFNEYLKDWFKGGTFGGDPTAEILRVMRTDGYLFDSTLEQDERIGTYVQEVGSVALEHPAYVASGVFVSNIAVFATNVASGLIPGQGPEGDGAGDGSNDYPHLFLDGFRANFLAGPIAFSNFQSPTIQRDIGSFMDAYHSKYSYEQRTSAEVVSITIPFLPYRSIGARLSRFKSPVSDALFPSFAGMPGMARGSVINPAYRITANSSDHLFRLAKHGDMPSPRPGQQSHHGAMSAWMKKHFDGYDPNKAPAILMPEASHHATFGIYNTWRADMRRSMNETFDWTNVSEAQMRSLSEQMFDAAQVPAAMRQDYWRWFDRMKSALGN